MRLALGLTALLALALWALAQDRPDPKPDAKAAAAVEKLAKKLAAARSIAGEVEVSSEGRKERLAFKFAKPNRGWLKSEEMTAISDGTTYVFYVPIQNEYMSVPAAKTGFPRGTAINAGGILGLESIAFPNEPRLVPIKMRSATFGGSACQAVDFASPENASLRGTLYLSSKTGLPVGWRFEMDEVLSEGVYLKLELNPKVIAGEFTWKAPPGAKRVAG